jgi:dTDP-4-amino-4,6-dideoxygalactose transaminase
MTGVADPGSLYRERKGEIDVAVARVLDSGRYILGEEVASFEREFAAYVGTRHAVGVASGTDALEVALRACDIGPGADVYTVSHTAGGTVAAILRCGATPVLIDVDPLTYTMEPALLDRALTEATGRGSGRGTPRAVIPVHLYGCPADMPAVLEIARRHGLVVIEDCAQAHGAALSGRRLGSWGDMAAFSFYPSKNLAAMGDAGMVVCSDDRLAADLESIRQYGWGERQISVRAGVNSRLDEIQAAILRVRLGYLEGDNERRRQHAAMYDELLAETAVALPRCPTDAHHVYHQYVVRSGARDELMARLRRYGIDTAIHYPHPIHLQPGFRDRVQLGSSLAVTERLAREVLSLPVHPAFSADDVRHVAQSLIASLAGSVEHG